MEGEPLMCPRCDKEIVPGSDVDLITAEDLETTRIFTDGELIVVHARCPE